MGVAISCAHYKAGPPKPVVKIEEKNFLQDLSRSKSENLMASFDIEIEGKERMSGGGEWTSQQGIYARLEISDPLGRTHYLCLQKNKKMVFYYPQQKIAYIDNNFGKAYFNEFLHLPITYKEFESILLGQYLKAKKSQIVETTFRGESFKIDYGFKKGPYPKTVRLHYRGLNLFVEWGDFEVLKTLLESKVFEADFSKETKILVLK
jgi:vacuolar-type H+-ATPase subunit C/Vma6